MYIDKFPDSAINKVHHMGFSIDQIAKCIKFMEFGPHSSRFFFVKNNVEQNVCQFIKGMAQSKQMGKRGK